MTTIAYESAIIEQPLDRVWAALRPMDMVFNPRVQSTRMGLDRVVPTRPWGVGEVGVITYVDGTKQDVRLTELSDANHTLSYEVVSSTPPVAYSSAQTTISCRRVTDSAVKGGATFVEWEVDFSRDADANVVADAAFKAKDALNALKLEAAKAFNWYTTAEAAAAGYDLTGKTYVVTGGNSGIGFETVRVLALRGAHVVFTARDDKKIADTVADLRKGQATAKVEGMVCALDDFKSIRAFAAAYKAKGYPIAALILNAGVMACPFGKTAQGFETQVGTNHIGHHLLTTLLLDVLKKSAPARVVVVSSAAHRRGDVRLDDLNYTARPNEYEPWAAYGQSKTANILFAKALHARLAKAGVKVSVNALHPGVIPTNLSRHIGPVFAPQKPGAAAAPAAGAGADAKDNAKDKKDDKKEDFATKTAASLQSPLFVPRIKSIPQGAATTIVAALHPAYAEAGGLYLSDCNPTPTLPHANDLAKAEKLWDLTEKLIADSKA